MANEYYNLKKGHDKEYYNSTMKENNIDQSPFGEYQFVSLDDIISQFMAVYVGDEKIINKVSRSDVGFWAQRALAELSFDTLKSIKSQQINVPPSLVMILPADYVNYTHISWVDDKGIKHPIYKTTQTSNPFQIAQEEEGVYFFGDNSQLVQNGNLDYNFTDDFSATSASLVKLDNLGDKFQTLLEGRTGWFGSRVFNSAANNNVEFRNAPHRTGSTYHGSAQAFWQEIDVTGMTTLEISANATSIESGTGTSYRVDKDTGETITETFTHSASTVRFGLSTIAPDAANIRDVAVGAAAAANHSSAEYFDLGYVEWTAGESGEKSITGVDVSNVSGTVYVLASGQANWPSSNANNKPDPYMEVTSTIDELSVRSDANVNNLKRENRFESSTWTKFKSAGNAEAVEDNTADVDDFRVNAKGQRYGLEPSTAQSNGSFYIDEELGRIHFSSNISGKDVILDYISDSLGTWSEMKVHKFAEEAMYRSITHGVLSTKLNVPEYIVQRAKKEKFAATRQAKLRLSNIKISDLTRILRGKSKQIK